MSNVHVGEVRPSQLMWTYGPGALVDLPNISVVTMGIHLWDRSRCSLVLEDRLLESVRQVLGDHVKNLLSPPIINEESVNPFSAEALVGVRVKPFPRWMRCVRCNVLSHVDTGVFTLKENPFRPEMTRYVHRGCSGANGNLQIKDGVVVPSRFLLACRNGHLDEFPWQWFVHRGSSDCNGVLSFFESGDSLQTEKLWVKCGTCQVSRSIAQAFGGPGEDRLPACRGRHPHLNGFEGGCDETPRVVLLGASNGWFPVTLSALAIPDPGAALDKLVREGADLFSDVVSEETTGPILRVVGKSSLLPGIDSFDEREVWEAIKRNRQGTENVGNLELKSAEWEVFSSPAPPSDQHFRIQEVGNPAPFERYLKRVLLVERLREVNALVGFTRIESGTERVREEGASWAPIGAQTDWVPVTQVHGEGIFLQFDELILREWEGRDALRDREAVLAKAYAGWRNKRGLDPNLGCQGARHALLHTISHLLIRELALDCGYNSASIRERVYAETEDGASQAGILIYTAAADSDGTLGGLVELGKPENLGRLLSQALDRAKVCASDPLCAEHDPTLDQVVHGASCHACSFVSETSCEFGNRNLDRTLVVPTLNEAGAAFFAES